MQAASVMRSGQVRLIAFALLPLDIKKENQSEN